MYLDGQLPGGPPSLNQGGQTNPYGRSNLWNNPPLSMGRNDDANQYGPSIPRGPGSPKSGANPLDMLDETFFVTPDGGPVVVSPSLATYNGIVQTPITQPSTLYPPQIPIEPEANACNGLGDYNPATLITPGVVPLPPANQPVAGPNFTDTPSGRTFYPCPGYANDGSLISFRNNAMRGMSGMPGCCQSGYQGYDNLKIPDQTNWAWILAAAAGLMLLASSPEKKKKGAR